MERPGEGVDAQPARPKSCIGALYFSSSRYDREKPPVCAGLSKRLRSPDAPERLPSDAVPGGEFRYLCIGYSAYDAEEMKREARRRGSPTDAVQLPHCAGLEVVSAAAVSGKPELLTSGPAVGAPRRDGAAAPTAAERDADVRQRPGRRFVAGGQGQSPDGLPDWDQFVERFDRMARRIADKMASNAVAAGQAAKRSWEQLAKELFDGDKGRRDR